MQDYGEISVGVIGAGLMGHGIAIEFARNGASVRIYDKELEVRRGVVERIRGTLELMSKMDLVSPDATSSIIGRITIFDEMEEAVAPVEYVVEAVTEDLSVKTRVFRQLDEWCSGDVVLASNTSALSPSALGAATRRPENVLVTHFFNPPFLLPLVEIVPGKETSSAAAGKASAMCRLMGKKTVTLQKEAPGFLVNRLQFALFREAMAIVDGGIATPEDVDRATVLSFGNRLGVLGPFHIADIAGLDVYEAICDTLFADLDNSNVARSSITRLTKEGNLGAKTGRGYFQWAPGEYDQAREALARHAKIMFGEG
tara:strand:- start:469 stop:1407 length:939 start_codon:yes stop_codon:yes gene_type:complete